MARKHIHVLKFNPCVSYHSKGLKVSVVWKIPRVQRLWRRRLKRVVQFLGATTLSWQSVLSSAGMITLRDTGHHWRSPPMQMSLLILAWFWVLGIAPQQPLTINRWVEHERLPLLLQSLGIFSKNPAIVVQGCLPSDSGEGLTELTKLFKCLKYTGAQN